MDPNGSAGRPCARSSLRIAARYAEENDVTLFRGDCLDLLKSIPDGSAQLVITSPPYNLGKEYEQRLDLAEYARQQAAVISECVRAISPRGNICWQVGNYVDRGAIVPLDALLYPIFSD